MTLLLPLFILGLVHGFTPCEHSWPMFFSYILSKRKLSHGLWAAVALVVPAILVWTILGGISGYIGYEIWRPAYQIPVSIILGCVLIGFGVYALWFLKIPHYHGKECDCEADAEHEEKQVKHLTIRQLIFYGFTLGFGPCATVLLLYAFAAEHHDVVIGVFAGLFFGVGTLLARSVLGMIVGAGLQFFEFHTKKDWSGFFMKLSGMILIFFGLYEIVSVLFYF